MSTISIKTYTKLLHCTVLHCTVRVIQLAVRTVRSTQADFIQLFILCQGDIATAAVRMMPLNTKE